MYYVGGKSRILKHLLPFIHSHTAMGRAYVEPFLGGCNVLPYVTAGRRVGGEFNPYVAAVWQAAQAGWIPPTSISEEQYRLIKKHPDMFPPEVVGFVACSCSFAAKWWGGYARNAAATNYAAQGSRNVVRKAAGLDGAELHSCSYDQLPLPPNSIIYCDPPYNATIKYKDDFNSEAFWEWAREKQTEGHELLVSEYHAPNGWECIWSKELVCTVGHKYSDRTERLFKLK